MITIINKLIALLPNPRREVFQTRRMVFRGIDPVPMWIVPDWFAVLLALDRRPHFDAARRFIHPCSACGREAILGTRVNVLAGQLGCWYCGACKPPSAHW